MAILLYWSPTIICSPDLTRLELILYVGLGLEKYLDYLNGFILILWYIGPGLEKDYLTGLKLILLNTALELIN